MIRSANLKETAKRESVTQACAISTSLAFFLLSNSIKKKAFAIATVRISKAETNEQIPQNTRKPGSSRLAKGEAIIEQKFRKHSANQPPNKPVTTGTRIGIVFFITSSLMPGVLSLYCNQTPLSRNFYAVTAQLMSFLYWSQHPTFSSEA